jgi:putative Mn2+ efflux pump MntP
MSDFSKTIIKYVLLIIIIFIVFKFLLPPLWAFLGWVVDKLIVVAMWVLIAVILFLLGNFIYKSYKNND